MVSGRMCGDPQTPSADVCCDAVHRYLIYLLSVESEIELPELDCASRAAEKASPAVHISLGTVPGTLSDPQAQSFLSDASSGQYLLRVPSVARYLVSGGHDIRIDAIPGADMRSVRLFLLESAFAALLHQRRLIPLHASAVDTPRGAVAFVGISSAGKSSLAASLVSRGYSLIADEICAVAAGEAGICALPAVPRLLLSREVIDELGLWSPAVQTARRNFDRYHVPVSPADFAAQTCPIRAIYFLEPSGPADYHVLPLSGLASVKALAGAGFQPSLLLDDVAAQGFIRATATLAAAARICRLIRPDKGCSLRRLTDLVEEDLHR